MTSPGEEPVVLAWPTTGRRATLAESVRSLLENVAAYGHRAEVVISHDRPEPEGGPCVSEAAALAAGRYGMPVTVLGPAEREARAGRLAREAARGDVATLGASDVPGPVGFLLHRAGVPRELWSAAAHHTAARLHAAGRLLITTDDDAFARPARLALDRFTLPADANAARARWSDDYLPATPLLFPDRDALLQSVAPAEVDIIGEHLALLGRDARDVVSDAGPGARPILLTTVGAYGDSGMSSNRSVVAFTGASRTFTTDDEYRKLRASRELVRIPPATTVGPGAHLMTMHHGVDCTVAPVPFFPAGRNSDGLSAVMTRLAYPASVTGFLDFGLLHNPDPPRIFGEREAMTLRPTPADLVMALLVAARPSAFVTDPLDRLALLGARLSDVASLPSGERAGAVHAAWSPAFAHQRERLLHLLDEYDHRPAAWAGDVEAQVTRIDELLTEPPLLFGDEGCGLSEGEFGAVAGAFGAALEAWGPVWEAALGR